MRKQALYSFQKMPKCNEFRARGELAKLIEDPHRNDIDVVKLQGRQGFRLRSGNWRVIFDRDDQIREIEVLRISLRSNIYKQ